LGLLLLGKARRGNAPLTIALQLSGFLVWMGLLLMTIPGLFEVRGAVQRSIEALLFGWLAWGSIKRLTRGWQLACVVAKNDWNASNISEGS
jgi:hypothetical protein